MKHYMWWKTDNSGESSRVTGLSDNSGESSRATGLSDNSDESSRVTGLSDNSGESSRVTGLSDNSGESSRVTGLSDNIVELKNVLRVQFSISFKKYKLICNHEQYTVFMHVDMRCPTLVFFPLFQFYCSDLCVPNRVSSIRLSHLF